MSKSSYEGLSDRTASLVTGVIGLAGSLTYIAAARRIEDSLLADAVGASGVPVAVGLLMAVASVALLVKALALPSKTGAAPVKSNKESAAAESFLRPHRLATGLLAILVVYLMVLPWLGYIVSIGLMAMVVAWFAGGRERNTLLGFAFLTGPILWFMFDFALKVHMPAGFWPKLFTG